MNPGGDARRREGRAKGGRGQREKGLRILWQNKKSERGKPHSNNIVVPNKMRLP